MLIDAGDKDGDYGYEDITDAIEEDVCECRGPDDTYVIDHFVLSHDHQDHNKYIENLQADNTIEVENWYRPPVSEDEDDLSSNSDGVDWTDMKTRGEEIPFGDEVEVEVKHPQEEGSPTKVCDGSDVDNKDCNSFVLEVSHEGHTFLFAGDIKSDSSKAIGRLGQNGEEEYSDIDVSKGTDVVKIPHHGTYSSYDE